MATSGASQFEIILTSFKKRISPEDTELFGLTTFDDLKASIKRIQTEQAARKGMRNLNKIKPFLTGLKQYSEIIEVFVQAKPEILAFIWGPIKLCLQIASKLHEAFDALLDAYEKIGNSLPIFSTVEIIFHSHPHLKQVLANIFEDILDFHKRAVVFFKHGTWRLAFKLTHHTFDDMFGDVLRKLDRSRDLLLQSANVAHFQESQDSRILLTKKMEVLLEADRNEQKRAIIDWLSSDSSSTLQHRDLADMRNMLPDTTRWIFSQPQVLDWLTRTEDTACTFWLCGIPGAGKTVIFSSVIDEINSTVPNAQIAYFYCKNNEPRRSTFPDIIKSLISQILHQNPNCMEFIYKSMISCNERWPTDPSRLLKVLEQILSCHDSLYIGIDGLDECSEKERKLLPSLITLVSRANDAQGNVRLIVTSRQEKDLEKSLKSAVKFTIKEKNIECDIKNYITYKMAKLCEIFPLTPEREKLITKEICSRPKDMFLLARLIMDNLLSQDNMEDLNEELKFEVLPHGIEEAYGRMLVRIGKADSSNPTQREKRRQRARLVLTLITTSQRALYHHEIQGALAISLEEENVNFKDRHSVLHLDDLCGPIIQIRQNGLVEMIHPTAKDYLWQHHSNHYIAASGAKELMATLCTSFLTFDLFDPGLAEELFNTRVMSGDFAFQEYAACNWFKHLKSLFSNNNVETLPPKFLQTILILQKRLKIQSACSPKLQSGQLCKSDVDQFLSEVEQLYNQTDRIAGGSPETQDQIPYLLAQIDRSRSVIEDQVIKGTEQESVNKFHGKLLFRCPVLQCPYFVTGFRSYKEREKHYSNHQRPFTCPHDTCDYYILGLSSESALNTHLGLCHEDLSQASVFPQIKSGTLEQALEEAIAENNILAITELATELVSLPERKNGFVLQALELGHREAALILLGLLGTPSEINHVHKKSAAILKVCETGDEELFDILVEKGANLNVAKETDALTIAAQNCHLSIIRKLLDNSNYGKYWYHATYKRKGTLAIASAYDHAEVISLLLERDTYYSTKIRNGKYPIDFTQALNAAIKERHVSCAKILLGWAFEKNPSILPLKIRKLPRENIDDMIDILSAERSKVIESDGGTKGNVLQAKAFKGDCEAVSHLLDLGADIDDNKGNYGTPMMAAALNGKLEMIRLLIERGAGIMKIDDSKHGTKGSAIDVAAANCHETVVQTLLEKGAVFTHDSNHYCRDWKTFHGRTSSLQALSVKADPAALTITRLILDSGANVDAIVEGVRYREVRTPLQLAAAFGHDANLQLLLEYGADVNHQGSARYTPLQLAVQRHSHSLPSILTLLSAKAIEVNAKSGDPSGMTALHLAAKLKKPDVLEILLDHGVDIDIFNTKGEIALVVGAGDPPWVEYSVERYQETIHILVERGADIEAVDGDGNTVLMVAARHPKQPLETIRYLLGKRAEISTKNFKGLTTLMIAAGHGHEVVVECLLQSRTNQYLEANEEVESAMELATRNGHVETVRVLLEFSNKMIGRDYQYLLLAAHNVEDTKKHSDMINLLEEYGATFTPLAHELDQATKFTPQHAPTQPPQQIPRPTSSIISLLNEEPDDLVPTSNKQISDISSPASGDGYR